VAIYRRSVPGISGRVCDLCAPNSSIQRGEELVMKSELVHEVGRFIFFTLAVAGWTYFMLALAVGR
jgi:hypothetical protein